MEIIGLIFMFAFVTPVVLLAFAGFYWDRARDTERVSAAWRAYARRRGHVFTEPTGEWPNRTPPGIAWTENEVAYRVEARGRDTAVSTRVVARPSVALLGELFVSRADGEVALKEGAEPLGGRLFVRTHPAALRSRVLTEDVTRALLGFDLGSLSLAYSRGEVSLRWAGGEENDARLDEASAVVRRIVKALSAAHAPVDPVAPPVARVVRDG